MEFCKNELGGGAPQNVPVYLYTGPFPLLGKQYHCPVGGVQWRPFEQRMHNMSNLPLGWRGMGGATKRRPLNLWWQPSHSKVVMGS